MAKPPRLVSASDVGKAAYCPHSLSLQKRYAYSSDARQRAGTKAHNALNESLLSGQDSRCFIATHALGAHDPDTQALRDWRDRVLMTTPFGRALVRFYYWSSPWLIRRLLPGMRSTQFVARCLRRFAARVKP